MSKLILSRILIQTTSPLAINSGERDIGFDASLARDWNGLPYIPATSIAGVLSSLAEDYYGENSVPDNKKFVPFCDYWFGSSMGNGRASRLIFSDGLVVDDNGKVELGIRDISNKNFLKKLKHNVEKRERCRINQRGVSMNKAKFDTQILPAGLRFSFDIIARTSLNQESEDDFITGLNDVIALIGTEGFCLGSNTRTGLGQVEVKGYEQKIVDLSTLNPNEVSQIIRNFSSSTEQPKNKDSFPKVDESKSPFLKVATLKMKGLDSWAIGSGPIGIDVDKESKAKKFCYTEHYIDWNTNSNQVIDDDNKRRIVVCGSMIKGIMSHRMEFHYRRLTEKFAEKFSYDELSNEEKKTLEIKTVSKDLQELLGYINDDTKNRSSLDKINGKASALFIKESVIGTIEHLKGQVVNRSHNKIDRFTGGTIASALFSEERLYYPEIKFDVYIRRDRMKLCSKDALKALYFTLCDIKEGFLPISSGSSRQAGLLQELPGCEISAELENIINE